VTDRRGRESVRTNVRFDSYDLACLGKDLAAGGEGQDADTLIVNGQTISEKSFPPVPEPQPKR
jgi:hypothetical protein